MILRQGSFFIRLTSSPLDVVSKSVPVMDPECGIAAFLKTFTDFEVVWHCASLKNVD